MKRIFILIFLTASLFANELFEDIVKNMLERKFLQTYPSMEIENIDIKSASSINKKFSTFKVVKLSITKDNLRRNRGSVLVTLKKGNKRRNFYFRYNINATIALYKTTIPIKTGREITPDLVSLQRVKFKTLYDTPIKNKDFYKYIAKTNIKEDSVLSLRVLKKLTDIKRNDIVTAIIKEGGVTLSFSAKALGEGNIGDIIKIRRDHKKIFKAKIVSKNSVEVLD